MDGLCSTCIHNEVCKYKEDYYKAADLLKDDEFGIFVDNNTKIVESPLYYKIECLNYMFV